MLLQIDPIRVEARWNPPSGFPQAKYRVYFNTSNVNTGGSEVNETHKVFEPNPGSSFTIRVRASVGTYWSVPAVSSSNVISKQIFLDKKMSADSTTDA